MTMKIEWQTYYGKIEKLYSYLIVKFFYFKEKNE